MRCRRITEYMLSFFFLTCLWTTCLFRELPISAFPLSEGKGGRGIAATRRLFSLGHSAPNKALRISAKEASFSDRAVGQISFNIHAHTVNQKKEGAVLESKMKSYFLGLIWLP